MRGGILDEAYERFHATGPEWGEDQLTNHGPMAAEVLVRRGYPGTVDRWVDRYVRRLDELPTGTLTGWIERFARELAERPWREVLEAWWPRLLPGIAAGTTHGVIRVGHVVRVLLTGAETPQALRELAHGLAFWAYRSLPVPPFEDPAGSLDPGDALDAMPRISQGGTVRSRFAQLEALPDWGPAVAALRPPADPDDARSRLTDLVTAATVRYPRYAHASPVILVHTATAPNAVLHTLPALPRSLWAPSLSAVWGACAAIHAAYAPLSGKSPGAKVDLTAEEIIELSVKHGDEHVIKFTDTAAEVYTRTGDPEALAAAMFTMTILERAPARR